MAESNGGARDGLIGRDAEFGVLARFLDELADGRPNPVVLRGPAGVGKSHLLTASVMEAAQQRGFRVVQSAGHAAEGPLPYIGLADLFDGIELAAHDMAAVQRTVLEVVLRRQASPRRAGDPLTVGTAVRSILASLAKDRPTLIVIDDLQWFDSPSWDAVMFAFRRLRQSRLRVSLGATWRVGEGDTERLESFFAEFAGIDLSVGPLSDASISAIVAGHAPSLSTGERALVVDRAGGYPLFALELARHPTADALPASVDASFGRRLRLLSDDALEAIGLCALSTEPRIEVLMACLGRERANGAIDELAASDLARPSQGQMQYRHPLVAAAVSTRLSTATAHRLRTMLAGAALSASERARHLRSLHAPPHAETADVLVAASSEHLLRGVLHEAARLAGSAAEYTPLGDKYRDDRIAAAVRLFVDASLAHEAQALIDRIGPLTKPRSAAWADWARAMASMTQGRLPDAEDQLRRVAAGSDYPEIVVRACLDHSYLLSQIGRFTDSATVAAAAVAASSTLPDAFRSEVLATEVAARATAGLAWDRPQLAEALRLEDFDRRTLPHLRATGVAAITAIFDDDHSAAEAHLMRLIEMGAAGDSTGEHGWTSMFLAYVRYRLGTMNDESTAPHLDSITWLGGLYDQARRVVTAAEPFGPLLQFIGGVVASTPGSATVAVTLAGGRFMAEGRHDEFLTVAVPLLTMLEGTDVREPIIMIWAADVADAYVATGNLDEARRTIEFLRAMNDQIPRRSVAAALARAQASLDEASGDLEAAWQQATLSVEGFAALEWPSEHGRALLVRAHVARRRHQHRAALDDAHAATIAFGRAGAAAWMVVAQREVIRMTRARRGATDERTETQTRVAELLRVGKSNNEIAASLHISVKTVESHLTQIYRLAGVRGRAEFLTQEREN